ncbi:MAG: response regulator [Geobacteraceae bacterium]|nr:response regulator [Geobacteraceae bacterium]
MNGRGTILVVDDTPESLRALTGILQQEGYSVRPANSGQLALASIAAQPPDLILLDIRMPGLDGFEVCRRLKSEEATRNIPVIFQSAATDLADRLEGLKMGAVDYITKPFQREELLARVKTHLELALLRGHLEVLVQERTAQLELEVAERKRAEEQLRLLNEELEERVRQRTAELAAKNTELEQMNRIFVGRELRMMELKERIRALEGLPGGNLDNP